MPPSASTRTAPSPVMILRRIVGEVRRQLDHRDPERAHAEAGAHAPESAAEYRLEILEPLDGHVRHPSTLRRDPQADQYCVTDVTQRRSAPPSRSGVPSAAR